MYSNFLRRLGSVLCAVAVALWLSAALFVTSAAGGKGSMQLVCMVDNSPVRGMSWSIYNVGTFTADGKLLFHGEFADYPIYIPDVTASSLQNAATTLENYVAIDEIESLASGVSDQSGIVKFDDLEDGVYLITGERLLSGTKIYNPVPMFLDVKNGKAVTGNVKMTVTDRPFVNNQMYSVLKTWKYGTGGQGAAPFEVEVEIYRDDVLVETVKLNNSNNWRYSWTGDANSEWRCKEVTVSDEYKVVINHTDTQFVIENNRDVLNQTSPTTTETSETTTTATVTTLSSDVSTSVSSSDTTSDRDTVTNTTTITTVDTSDVLVSTSSSVGTVSSNTTATTVIGGGGKLPQTGQLWWPVPVCGASGIVLFTVGWRLNKKKK